MTTRWCMVPEILSATERFFCHFGPFFALLQPKISKFWKNFKKTPGDITILQKCTKNQDHMLYCSWDMARDGCKCYFSFWTTFCPFTPLTARKMKISKKWKKYLEISSFYTSVPKVMMLYGSWEVVHDGRTDERKKGHIEVGAPPKN